MRSPMRTKYTCSRPRPGESRGWPLFRHPRWHARLRGLRELLHPSHSKHRALHAAAWILRARTLYFSAVGSFTPSLTTSPLRLNTVRRPATQIGECSASGTELRVANDVRAAGVAGHHAADVEESK